MKDINGQILRNSNIVFYSELPRSNHADALYRVIIKRSEIALKALLVRKHENLKEYYEDKVLPPFDFNKEKELIEFTHEDNLLLVGADEIVNSETLESYSEQFKKIVT